MAFARGSTNDAHSKSTSGSEQLSAPKNFLSLRAESNRESGGKNYLSLDNHRIIGKVSPSQVLKQALQRNSHGCCIYIHE